MKLKDVLGRINENKKNGQLNTCLRKKKIRELGIDESDLLNFKIDTKLKKLLIK